MDEYIVCRERESNPHGPCDPRDFKSRVSTIPPPRHLYVGARAPTHKERCSDLPAGRQVPPRPALALAKPEARFIFAAF